MLTNKLEKVENKKVAIWMHESPDPDAIGSALGLGWIFKKKLNMSYDIFYNGTISHPENRSLINVLNLSFNDISEYYNNKKEYAYTCIVDGTEKNIGSELEADVIIDHHKVKLKEDKYKFVLNSPVGACCSLIFKLIKEEKLEFTADDIVPSTALLFGIIKDTNYFLSDNVTDLDFEAFSYFREYANLSSVQEIRSYPIPSYMFEYEVIASHETNKVETNGSIISFLGQISQQRRDVLPYLADRLMRKEATDTTIILAIIDNHLECSIRSKKVSLDVNEFVHKIFGEEYSGGKRGAGGAKVPLGFFKIPEDDNDLREEIILTTKNMVISKIKKELMKDG